MRENQARFILMENSNNLNDAIVAYKTDPDYFDKPFSITTKEIIYPNSVYQGTVKTNGNFYHGYGCLTFNYGEKYEGWWKDHKK